MWDEFAGQTIWLNPPICAFPLELDTSLADEFSPEAELHRGMLAALTQSLTPAQSAQIRQSLETSAAEVCTRIGITPDNLGQLVETNPLVAIDLLLRIMQTDNLLPYTFCFIYMYVYLKLVAIAISRPCISCRCR